MKNIQLLKCALSVKKHPGFIFHILVHICYHAFNLFLLVRCILRSSFVTELSIASLIISKVRINYKSILIFFNSKGCFLFFGLHSLVHTFLFFSINVLDYNELGSEFSQSVIHLNTYPVYYIHINIYK